MMSELQLRIDTAYVMGDLDYFHGKQFIQDMAALGWGLSDLPSSSICIKGDDGKFTITPIWPDLEINLKMRIGLVNN